MKKVLLTATVQSHIAQFHKPLINMLKESGNIVHVAARDNLSEKNGLNLNEPDKVFNIPFARSPLSKSNISAFDELRKIIDENSYDIVHCNTPMGGVITRLAANKYRKNGMKVFYTAHGFHFYKGAPLINWLVYYPIEKFLARYTDKLITISSEDYNLAIEKRFMTRVEHIYGVGADSDRFFPISKNECSIIRKKEKIGENEFVCLCIGELNRNKNQETVIKAFSKLIKVNNNLKLLIAGNGPLETKLKDTIRDNDGTDRIILTGYRSDIENLVKISDVVVSASIREGLGLNIIEGMMCGKPVIGSTNRGHRELIKNMHNGLLVDTFDYESLAGAINLLYTDHELKKKMQENAMCYSEKYSKLKVAKQLKNIYEIEEVGVI